MGLELKGIKSCWERGFKPEIMDRNSCSEAIDKGNMFSLMSQSL